MSNDKMVTALALVLVALPGTAQAIPNLSISPEMNFVLLALAILGGAILKQQNGSGLSDEDVRRIAVERERLRRSEIQKVREAGQRG